MNSQCRTTLTTPVKRTQRQKTVIQPTRTVPWALIVGSIVLILVSLASFVWIARYQATIADYIRNPSVESRAKAHAYIGYPTPTFDQPLIDAADRRYERDNSSNPDLDRLQEQILKRDTGTRRSVAALVEQLLPSLTHNADTTRMLLSEAIALVGPCQAAQQWETDLAAIEQATILPSGTHLTSISFNPATTTAVVTCEGENEPFVADLQTVDFQVLDDHGRIWPHFTVTEVDRSFSNASVVMLIDRSLSMEGQPMEQLKKGLRKVLESVTESTRIQVVAFDHVVEALTPFTSEIATLQQSIESIQPQGATAIADALNYAIGILQSQTNAKAIFLCTDGQDENLRSGLSAIIERCHDADVQVNALAIEHSQLDKATLEQLTSDTNGCLAYADKPQAIASQLAVLVQSCKPSYQVKLFPANKSHTSFSIRLRNNPNETLPVR